MVWEDGGSNAPSYPITYPVAQPRFAASVEAVAHVLVELVELFATTSRNSRRANMMRKPQCWRIRIKSILSCGTSVAQPPEVSRSAWLTYTASHARKSYHPSARESTTVKTISVPQCRERNHLVQRRGARLNIPPKEFHNLAVAHGAELLDVLAIETRRAR